MFKKLRNKFLILNIITISVLMLISFVSIYIIMAQNIYSQIDMELHKISEPRKPGGSPLDGQFSADKEFDKPFDKSFEESDSRPQRNISFSIFLDKEKNKLDYTSVFDFEEEFYEEALKSALERNNDKGDIKVQDRNWSYMLRPEHYGYKIVFLDITSQKGILTKLIYTFLAVGLIMLIFIFFISRFFANKSIKPVEEAFEKQKQFVSDASHELKTPLAVINTNVDVLLANREDTIDNQSKWLHYIKSESERMTKLTNDLLYLTRMDYSEVKMIYTEADFSNVVESVILTMEGVIFENGITLEYNIEPGLKTYGNREQLSQVVMILLDNAIKYTAPNGGVKVDLKKRHNELVLSVTNGGEGIEKEHLDKIFHRFYRVDKSRVRMKGGYGLGLAIAKAIIDQHGGKIYARSIISQSTTFYVELSRR